MHLVDYTDPLPPARILQRRKLRAEEEVTQQKPLNRGGRARMGTLHEFSFGTRVQTQGLGHAKHMLYQ